MSADLTTILKMRKPKGRDVGAAMLINLANDFAMAGQQHEPLFPQEKLTKMIDAFTSSYELRVYSNYADIVSGAEHLSDYSESCLQQFMNGYYRIINVLAELTLGYHIQNCVDELRLDEAGRKLLLKHYNDLKDFASGDECRDYIYKSYHNFIYPALRDMHAYNRFWQILASSTGIDELENINANTQLAIYHADQLNQSHDEIDPVFIPLFPPIDFDCVLPDESRCRELENMLKNINSERCPSLLKLKQLAMSLGATIKTGD